VPGFSPLPVPGKGGRWAIPATSGGGLNRLLNCHPIVAPVGISPYSESNCVHLPHSYFPTDPNARSARPQAAPLWPARRCSSSWDFQQQLGKINRRCESLDAPCWMRFRRGVCG